MLRDSGPSYRRIRLTVTRLVFTNHPDPNRNFLKVHHIKLFRWHANRLVPVIGEGSVPRQDAISVRNVGGSHDPVYDNGDCVHAQPPYLDGDPRNAFYPSEARFWVDRNFRGNGMHSTIEIAFSSPTFW